MLGSKTSNSTVSVCIATQNSAHKLANAIKSVLPFADEIIVVDGGSSDDTRNVASSFDRVRYFYHAWQNNFAIQKNYAMDQATSEWILVLDSDEAVGAKMRKKIGRLISSRRHDCYIFPTYWIIQTDPLRYVKSKKHYPSYHQRLFRNLPKYRYVTERAVHEKFDSGVQGVGKKIKDTHIFHFDFIYNDRKAREEKVRERNSIAPDTDHISRVHYLFEDYPYKIKKCWEKS